MDSKGGSPGSTFPPLWISLTQNMRSVINELGRRSTRLGEAESGNIDVHRSRGGGFYPCPTNNTNGKGRQRKDVVKEGRDVPERKEN